MSRDAVVSSSNEGGSTPLGARGDLLLISLLLLYLELACIRWFPAHVLYLTFFTNTILLASFLGMSLGCLAARRTRTFLVYTPFLLLVAMTVAQLISAGRTNLESVLRVGNPQSPQLVFFGTEYAAQDPTRFVVPIEIVEGFFFLIVALIMMGPGQELGRALNRVPNRLQAYSVNILGSLMGIVVFALCSYTELSPIWWFSLAALAIGYLVFASGTQHQRLARWAVIPCLICVPLVATWTSGAYISKGQRIGEHLWSPYYRIDYDSRYSKQLSVNLIAHQIMVSRDDRSSPSYAYALPHLLQRDAGGPPFDDVLIIGAGSGNDLSRALAWGARHVDAVEIDPTIQRIGQADHPDKPYQDSRVTVHIADGRNFLRVSPKQYDLIEFALVDSLVLHSGYSNIRLESFMFTREALADVRDHLKPGGMFVMYNYFRQGWIVGRLTQGLRDVFGGEPLVLTLPFVDVVQPETSGGFTMLLAGATDRIRQVFDRRSTYWLARGQPPSPESPNGFEIDAGLAAPERWIKLAPARVVMTETLRPASDDWPFLYLRRPMIPDLSIRGALIMGGVALALFAVFLPAATDDRSRWRLNGQMFFLGAGFMLVETKAVVHMALLFGSTWIVNTVVFAGVLVMILGANLFVTRVRPVKLGPYYAGLLLALLLNAVVPLDSLLGLSRGLQVTASILLAFAPILFAGVIFAAAFGRSTRPDHDFGSNVAGAMLGGLAENASMLLGFQYLSIVVMVFYLLSAGFRGGLDQRVGGGAQRLDVVGHR